jgi:hypothetical protein
MEPDRFDDVGSRIIEGPDDEAPPARRRRWGLVAIASVLAAGALAAGASALTTSEEPAAPAAKQRPKVSYTADGIPIVHSGRGCKAGQAHRRGHEAASTPRY